MIIFSMSLKQLGGKAYMKAAVNETALGIFKIKTLHGTY